MKLLNTERIAVLATVVGIIAAFAWPFFHETDSVEAHAGTDIPVITITGVAATGVWTDQEVRGGNYFAKEFRPARPVLNLGETVVLRFKSADVVHTFYCPELAIGPVEVYPGHVADVEVTPTEAGAFDYYCTTVCGKPHFRMRGQIVVQSDGLAPDDPGRYWLEDEPYDTSLVARGEWLFRQNACFSCHGRSGHGGVRNPNYIKGTVPALDTLAERMYLFYPEDVDAIVEALEQRIPLEHLEDDPPVLRYRAVLAKYQSIKELLRKGNPAGKLDPDGPEPPLNMPTWGQRLSDSDIDALIAFLLTLEPFDLEAQTATHPESSSEADGGHSEG
jgi:mono/diheme cytochrome c family protein